MSEADQLQRAVDQAEAEVAALEREVEAVTAQRQALSAQALAELEGRQEQLTRALNALGAEEESLAQQLKRLEQQLRRPGYRLPGLVATPLTWFLRACAFFVYVGSLLGAYHFISRPGLVLLLVVGLPVAFVLVMMAGSLRESGAASTPGVRASAGEEPAREAAVDERAGAPLGGSGGDRGAHLRADPPREGEGRGR